MIPAALAIARRLPLRYIAPAIGAALALWATYDWAHDRGRDSRDAEVALLIRERDTARDNVDTLQREIAARNAAIDLAAGKTRAAQDAAAEAGKRATDRGKALAGAKAAMADAARAVGPLCGCAVTAAQRDA